MTKTCLVQHALQLSLLCGLCADEHDVVLVVRDLYCKNVHTHCVVHFCILLRDGTHTHTHTHMWGQPTTSQPLLIASHSPQTHTKLDTHKRTLILSNDSRVSPSPLSTFSPNTSISFVQCLSLRSGLVRFWTTGYSSLHRFSDSRSLGTTCMFVCRKWDECIQRFTGNCSMHSPAVLSTSPKQTEGRHRERAHTHTHSKTYLVWLQPPLHFVHLLVEASHLSLKCCCVHFGKRGGQPRLQNAEKGTCVMFM